MAPICFSLRVYLHLIFTVNPEMNSSCFLDERRIANLIGLRSMNSSLTHISILQNDARLHAHEICPQIFFLLINKTDSCQTDLLKEKIQSLFSLMEAAVNTASGANKI